MVCSRGFAPGWHGNGAAGLPTNARQPPQWQSQQGFSSWNSWCSKCPRGGIYSWRPGWHCLWDWDSESWPGSWPTPAVRGPSHSTSLPQDILPRRQDHVQRKGRGGHHKNLMPRWFPLSFLSVVFLPPFHSSSASFVWISLSLPALFFSRGRGTRGGVCPCLPSNALFSSFFRR